MTNKQFVDWFRHAVEFIDGHPTENHWRQICQKLTQVKVTRKKVDVCESSEVQGIFKHWQEVMKHPRSRLDAARVKLIRKWLETGYTADDLKQAITGCSKTPHNQGKNDRGTRYDTLELILRTGDNIDRFMATGSSGGHIKAVTVSKCNYPGCTDPVHGQAFKRCGFHMAEEFKTPEQQQIDKTKEILKGRIV